MEQSIVAVTLGVSTVIVTLYFECYCNTDRTLHVTVNVTLHVAK